MSLPVRRVSRVGGDPVDVEIELGEPIIVRVSGIHPVALPDAVDLAVAAALRLHAALVPADTD